MIGPVVVSGPGAVASVRERVEEERIELLGASSSEGAVRWSKRLHFPCKSRCRSSGYWRELGMDSSLFIPTAHGFNLLPTSNSSMPQGTVRTLPEECIRPTGNIPPDQAVAADRGPEPDPNYGNGIPAFCR